MQPADSEMLGLPSSSNQGTNPELSVPLGDVDLETGEYPGIQKEETQTNSFVGSENATILFESSFSEHTSVQSTNLQDEGDTHSRLQYVEADCPGLQVDMRMTDAGEIEQLITEAHSPSLDPQDILRQSLEVGSPIVDQPIELEFTSTQITQAEHHALQLSFDEPMTHEPSLNMLNDTSIVTATEAWVRTSSNSNSSLGIANTLNKSSVPITPSTDSQVESSADIDSFPDFAAFEIDFLTADKLDDSDDDDSSQVDGLNFQYPDDITAYT
ncbi:hypothetical protein BDQ12DRAFT_463224 [Crucibulum laeve]|uniref:Uncharacterized protein n=1 Tax=Crucibulum laeve TaxID=68775 RepID=A0A5C3M5I7_9AGAR|nr:hypothetical protein BDQ12DRAFT_463224 [Crucibulum laeve]